MGKIARADREIIPVLFREIARDKQLLQLFCVKTRYQHRSDRLEQRFVVVIGELPVAAARKFKSPLVVGDEAISEKLHEQRDLVAVLAREFPAVLRIIFRLIRA